MPKNVVAAAVLGAIISSSLSACAVSTDAEAQKAHLASTNVELLTPGHPVMVIERGARVQLCLGGVLQSSPPGCADGIDLVGWDWDTVSGEYDEVGGVRWGEYLVTGTYDDAAHTLTVASVSDGVDAASSESASDALMFSTPCAEPVNGWQIIDESRATQETLNAAAEVASQIEGYAVTWADNALIPPVPANTDAEEDLQHYAIYAGRIILNVAVRGNVAEAETRLREVWCGALCVVSADHTAVELEAFVDEVTADYRWPVGFDTMTGAVSLSVPYDRKGILQRKLDDRYGAGRVTVQSVLVPA